MKHKVNHSDYSSFKEPYRRVPPALFQEIREHLTKILQAGTIKHSHYSPNIVIVRKKDGSIRFCVEFRKLDRMLTQYHGLKTLYIYWLDQNILANWTYTADTGRWKLMRKIKIQQLLK